MRFTLLLPPGSDEDVSATHFKKLVEEKTKNALEVSLLPTAERLWAPEVPAAVRSAAVDMGSILLDDLVKETPAIDLFVQPFMFHDQAVLAAAQAHGSPIREVLDRALLISRGLRILWWLPVGSGIALSSGEVVTTPKSIEGRRVRVSGNTLASWVTLCGGIPVQASGAEQYAALRSGRAEIAFADMSSVVPRKMWDVADTVTVTRHYAGAKLIAISEKVWQSLSPDHRRSIEEAARESERIGQASSEENERRDFETARKNGMTITEISAADVTEWKHCGVPLIASFLERAGRLGTEVLAGYRKILIANQNAPAVSEGQPGAKTHFKHPDQQGQ